MSDGLTLAQRMRVAAALQDQIVLRLDKSAAHSLIKVLERQAEVMRIIDRQADLDAALANMKAQQDRVEQSVFRVLALLAWTMLFVPMVARWAS
ncbi:hypothetical protein [Paracoccus siganidrum]|uniref:Uncharacterized protein n=1 Tax=Paracoccus siganidrum TaxID=1276757 RepID=A0A419A8M9_9RHOB|nr:hypothetical protein [Paracoccus siganidrum]RJL18232.1 hypothetical protein D3P05_07780 [Paracoccus siganidrum]